MNSMFSSFDAFCAELLGQTVKASFPAQQQQQKSAGTVLNNKASDADNLNGAKQEGNREASSISMPQQAQPVKKQQSQRALPRLALELDGLNCFKTVVCR